MDHILSRLTGQGLAIFPAHASKVPATPHGFRDAVKAANEAHRLFARYPAPLIGIATGSVSGVDVLDVDQRPQAREWFFFGTPKACAALRGAFALVSTSKLTTDAASGGPPPGARSFATHRPHLGRIGC